MLIAIDTGSTQPIFDQVSQQIKFAIAAGAIRVNEMIPSVRELSRQLAINPNTVARAYRLLQDEGVVVSRRGMGLAVSEGARERCRIERRAVFEQMFRDFLDHAFRSRLAPEEIDAIIQKVRSRVSRPSED